MASSAEGLVKVLVAVILGQALDRVRPLLKQLPAETRARADQIKKSGANGVVKVSGGNDTSGPMNIDKSHVARVVRAKDSRCQEPN